MYVGDRDGGVSGIILELELEGFTTEEDGEGTHNSAPPLTSAFSSSDEVHTLSTVHFVPGGGYRCVFPLRDLKLNRVIKAPKNLLGLKWGWHWLLQQVVEAGGGGGGGGGIGTFSKTYNNKTRLVREGITTIQEKDIQKKNGELEIRLEFNCLITYSGCSREFLGVFCANNSINEKEPFICLPHFLYIDKHKFIIGDKIN